jgi:hypothetical protein
LKASIKGVPSTAVVTTNVTRFTTDTGTVPLRGDPDEGAEGRPAAQTSTSIIGFTIGRAMDAACEAKFGLWSSALPTGLYCSRWWRPSRSVLPWLGGSPTSWRSRATTPTWDGT